MVAGEWTRHSVVEEHSLFYQEQIPRHLLRRCPPLFSLSTAEWLVKGAINDSTA